MKTGETGQVTVNTEHKDKIYCACPLCGSKLLKDRFDVRGYTISECKSCTVVFVRNILTPEFLRDFYQKQEGNCFYEEDNKDCINYYSLKVKLEIEKLKPEKGRILDIGCSSGMFLEQMEGWERHGVEVSDEYGKKARTLLGDNIFIGTFEAYPVKKDYFDVITLQDVCDHFIDPAANLLKCKEMLKPGGLIIIKVHNISCLFAKVCGKRFYAIEPPVHLFYFNERSLNLVLNKTGFRFLKKRFIGHLMKLKTVFFRLSRVDKKTPAYKIYSFLDKISMGNIKLNKNLHDIITVFAVKK